MLFQTPPHVSDDMLGEFQHVRRLTIQYGSSSVPPIGHPIAGEVAYVDKTYPRDVLRST